MRKFMLLWACVATNALAGDPTYTCFLNLANNPSFAAIKEVVALGSTKDQPIEMLSLDQRANAYERELIGAWSRAREECVSLGESWREANMPAAMQTLYTDYTARSQNLIASLQGGAISYGEFAKQRTRIAHQMSTEMNEAWSAHLRQMNARR